MRKVLLITTAYPPPNGGGTARTEKLMKWLPKCGYEPYVLTIAKVALPHGSRRILGQGVRFPNDNDQVCRIACKRYRLDGIRRSTSVKSSFGLLPAFTGLLRAAIRRLIYNVRDYPDPTAEWIATGISVGHKWATQIRPDLIYSSSGLGVSAHFVAYQLCVRLSLPWVQEYRDLWARNPWRTISSYAIRERIELQAERRFLSSSVQTIVMNDGMCNILSARHPAELRGRICVLPNGYDPEEFPSGFAQPKDLPLRICYMGTLYGGQRDMSGLFGALRMLVESGKLCRGDVEFIYGGGDSIAVHRMAEAQGASEFLRDLGMLAATEAKRVLLESHVLVIAEKFEEHPLVLANTPGKAYEYLGAKRAILALVHPDSAVADLVRATSSGVAMRPNDMSAIASYIMNAVRLVRSGSEILEERDRVACEQWSWPHLAERLRSILDKAACSSSGT